MYLKIFKAMLNKEGVLTFIKYRKNFLRKIFYDPFPHPQNDWKRAKKIHNSSNSGIAFATSTSRATI